MDAATIIRAAIPNADDAVCSHVLWGMTPYPVGPVTAKGIYRAACRLRRATENRLRLCDWCPNVATDGYTCESCKRALDAAKDSQ